MLALFAIVAIIHTLHLCLSDSRMGLVLVLVVVVLFTISSSSSSSSSSSIREAV